METTQQRQTAYKIWIANLISSVYTKGAAEFEPGYVTVNGNQISRINIIAGIIDKFTGEGYSTITLDDGTGTIRVKAWKEITALLNNFEVGDLVNVIGKVKSYNNEIFIAPEIARPIDNPLWLKVRKQELKKLYGEAKRVEQVIKNEEDTGTVGNIQYDNVTEEKVEEDPILIREKVYSLIESLDVGNGADSEDVIKSSGFGEEARKIIEELIKDGEVFEVNKGKIRVMG